MRDPSGMCSRSSPHQARVVGLLESSLAAMPGVGYLIGGALTAAGSPPTPYPGAGTGTLTLVLVAPAVLRPPRLDHPRRRREDAPPPSPPPPPPPAEPHEVSLEAPDPG